MGSNQWKNCTTEECEARDHNVQRTSDYPKDKVSFSPNEVEEQSVTCATRAKPSVSHEDIEAGQAIDEAEVEEDEEEYDTDSD